MSRRKLILLGIVFAGAIIVGLLLSSKPPAVRFVGFFPVTDGSFGARFEIPNERVAKTRCVATYFWDERDGWTRDNDAGKHLNGTQDEILWVGILNTNGPRRFVFEIAPRSFGDRIHDTFARLRYGNWYFTYSAEAIRIITNEVNAASSVPREK